jgi:hypothetical protein
MLVRFKINTIWLMKLSLTYMPIASVLISGFSDDITKYFEKKRPDYEAD